MRLATWRKREGKTQEWLADRLGCSQSYVSQIERATRPIIPGPPLMREIYRLTEGAVEPNDFYELPSLHGAEIDNLPLPGFEQAA